MAEPCVHWWKLDRATTAAVWGRCKRCGERRFFQPKVPGFVIGAERFGKAREEEL